MVVVAVGVVVGVLVAKGLSCCGKGVVSAAASFHAMEEEEELDINVTEAAAAAAAKATARLACVEEEEEEEEEEEVGSGRTVEMARQGREEGTSVVLLLKVWARRERETRNMVVDMYGLPRVDVDVFRVGSM
jgi:hypothetical protein